MSKALNNVRLGTALRELAAVGSMVDLSVVEVPEENVEVEIHQVGGVHESRVFELPDRRTGYIFDLEIINQTSETIYCSETELRTSWKDTLFDWLPDPRETARSFSYFRRRRDGRRERVDAVSDCYCFPGGAQLEYPRDLVLNHLLLGECTLPPRRPLKGLLLASGGLMPHDLRHGQWLNLTLALIASNHLEYTKQICLWTERLEVSPKRAKRAHNLYEDPVGFQVGSAVVVRDQRGAAHAEKSQSLHTDGDGRV